MSRDAHSGCSSPSPVRRLWQAATEGHLGISWAAWTGGYRWGFQTVPPQSVFPPHQYQTIHRIMMGRLHVWLSVIYSPNKHIC